MNFSHLEDEACRCVLASMPSKSRMTMLWFVSGTSSVILLGCLSVNDK